MKDAKQQQRGKRNHDIKMTTVTGVSKTRTNLESCCNTRILARRFCLPHFQLS